MHRTQKRKPQDHVHPSASAQSSRASYPYETTPKDCIASRLPQDQTCVVRGRAKTIRSNWIGKFSENSFENCDAHKTRENCHTSPRRRDFPRKNTFYPDTRSILARYTLPSTHTHTRIAKVIIINVYRRNSCDAS